MATLDQLIKKGRGLLDNEEATTSDLIKAANEIEDKSLLEYSLEKRNEANIVVKGLLQKALNQLR